MDEIVRGIVPNEIVQRNGKGASTVRVLVLDGMIQVRGGKGGPTKNGGRTRINICGETSQIAERINSADTEQLCNIL